MSKVVLKKSVLKGKIKVSGAKNSALKLLATSLLTDHEVELHNFPAGLDDIKINLEMFSVLNKRYSLVDDTLIVHEQNQELINDLEWKGRSIRNTLLMLGMLTSRTGYGRVPLPGGCKIGKRGYDLHEMVLKTLGAEVYESEGYLIAKAKNGLKGAEIHLPIRSTGATENAILSSVLAKGSTKIWNPHIRPEIIELIDFLVEMGANIQIRGQE